MISHMRQESKMAITLGKMYWRCITFTSIVSQAVQWEVEKANRKVKIYLRIFSHLHSHHDTFFKMADRTLYSQIFYCLKYT